MALSLGASEATAGDWRPWPNSKDPIRYLHVLSAFFPEIVREAIKDTMAEMGVTAEDLRELLEKTEAASKGSSTSKH